MAEITWREPSRHASKFALLPTLFQSGESSRGPGHAGDHSEMAWRSILAHARPVLRLRALLAGDAQNGPHLGTRTLGRSHPLGSPQCPSTETGDRSLRPLGPGQHGNPRTKSPGGSLGSRARSAPQRSAGGTDQASGATASQTRHALDLRHQRIRRPAPGLDAKWLPRDGSTGSGHVSRHQFTGTRALPGARRPAEKRETRPSYQQSRDDD